MNETTQPLYDANGNLVSAANQNAVVPTVVDVQPEAVEEPVDKSIVTLSSGVRVRFNKLPDTVAQELVTSIFNKSQLNKDGTIKDNLDTSEQMELAGNMMQYNSSMLLWNAAVLVDELPDDEEWLDSLMLNPIIARNNPHIDFTKKAHKEFLYLRYFTFTSEEDWAMLSQRAIGNG